MNVMFICRQVPAFNMTLELTRSSTGLVIHPLFGQPAAKSLVFFIHRTSWRQGIEVMTIGLAEFQLLLGIQFIPITHAVIGAKGKNHNPKDTARSRTLSCSLAKVS